MAAVQLDSVSKVYRGSNEEAVSNFSLDIDDGEFVVFVGPSGCGKSTALRMIAGLEEITGGQVRIGDRVVNDLPPQQRDIAMVFQNYALYPHMTVAKNLDYPLRIAKVGKAEMESQVSSIAATLQLSDLLERKPAQLSGGQRQRVAMGRALIRQPAVFLMDEPLSNLDAKLRVSMRAEIARIQSELGVTTVYVTHDQVEAMTMGDRVVVLNGGKLQQVDAPEVLYRRPGNVFVAGFIGSPAMNLFASRLTTADNGALWLALGEQRVRIDAGAVAAHGLGDRGDSDIIAGIRPDDIHDDVDADGDGHTSVRGTLMLREALGSETICHLDVGVDRIQIDDPDLEELGEGGGAAMQFFIGRFGPDMAARTGESIPVRVDPDRLHFFDPESGLRVEAV